MSEDSNQVRSKSNSISTRMGTLLAILEYLTVFNSVTLGELSDLFHISCEKILAELELAACCGVKPYTPDSLLDIEIDLPYLTSSNFEGDLKDVKVTANILGYFDKVQSLEQDQLFMIEELRGTISKLPEFDGSGILESAIDKLLKMPSNALKMQVSDPKFKNEIQNSIENRFILHINYFSNYRDEIIQKDIGPLRMKFVAGSWYLDAIDLTENVLKTFKNDRILFVDNTDATFILPEGFKDQLSLLSDKVYVAQKDKSQTVTIRIPSSLKWILETVVFEKIVKEDDESILIELSVSNKKWFERLLLANREIEVVSPKEFCDLGVSLAKRLIKIYSL